MTPTGIEFKRKFKLNFTNIVKLHQHGNNTLA